jgi:Ran-binding protein 3
MSDNEGGEKPVREKLKQTTIANPDNTHVTSHPASDADAAKTTEISQPTITNNEAGDRLRRKRSFEAVETADVDVESAAKPARHARKRSRDNDSNPPEKSNDSATNGSASKRATTPPRHSRPDDILASELLKSPKGKRNREQFLKDGQEDKASSINHAVAPTSEKSGSESGKNDNGEERGAKRPRDGGKTATEEKKKAGESKEKSTQV